MRIHVFAVCLLVTLTSGLVQVREGYKHINKYYPQYKNMAVAEVKAKLQEEIPGVEFEEFEELHPGEFYFGKVGLVVREGIVIEPPNHFSSKKIVENWTPYIGRPWETVMGELEQQEGLNGVKFLMMYDTNDKTLYDNRHGNVPFLVLRVNEHGDVQAPRDRELRNVF